MRKAKNDEKQIDHHRHSKRQMIMVVIVSTVMLFSAFFWICYVETLSDEWLIYSDYGDLRKLNLDNPHIDIEIMENQSQFETGVIPIAISPDRSSFVYQTTSADGQFLRLVNDTGTHTLNNGLASLATDEHKHRAITGIGFSPDSSQAIVATYNGLYLFDEAGDSRLLLPATQPNERFVTPRWSPDGIKIAFLSTFNENDNERGSLYVMDADGQNVQYVTDFVIDYGFPIFADLGFNSMAWSPDSSQLIMASPAHGRGIYIVDIATHEIHELIHNENGYSLSPLWSSNGEWIYFIRTIGSTTIFKVRSDGTDMQMVTSTRALRLLWIGALP